MDETSNCLFCRAKKALFSCEICAMPLCKNCLQRLSEDTFQYASEKPSIVEHSKFCPGCFDEKVSPRIAEYNEVLERAKQVAYLPRTYKTFVPVLKKAKEEVFIEKCTDRDQAILHLGFKAAEQGFNAVIHAEVKSEKVRNEGYQTSLWSGHALPATIDEERLRVQEYREEVYRRGY